MKIIENPKTKLESVELIDDNGALLRITPASLIGMDYDIIEEKDNTLYLPYRGRGMPKRLHVLVIHITLFGRDKIIYFDGEEAVKVFESLNKLKGH